MTLNGEIETLCGRLRLEQISCEDFVSSSVRLASRSMGCSRAALWLFLGTASDRALHCVAMHDRVRDRMVRAAAHSKDCADPFFDELEKYGQVVAHDACSHPATQTFFSGSTASGGVQSLIAMPLSLNGKLIGAMVCTQVNDRLYWSHQHLFMLRRLSVRATLAMAAHTTSNRTRSPRDWRAIAVAYEI